MAKKFEPLAPKQAARARIDKTVAKSSATEFLSLTESRKLQQRVNEQQERIAHLERELEAFGGSPDAAQDKLSIEKKLEAERERSDRHLETLEAMKAAMLQGHDAQTIAAIIDEYISGSKDETNPENN